MHLHLSPHASFKGKRVLIFQQRGWALSVGHFLAQRLQNEGAILAALTAKQTTHDFILSQQEVRYELIESSDAIKSKPREYLAGTSYSLESICASLQIDSIWPLVAGARNHVRSYKDKYYYGFRQNVLDEDIVLYVMAVYKCIEHIFSTFLPEAIIVPNFPTLHHLMFYHYAKARGVKMITLTDSKISGVYIFAHDYNYSEGRFYAHVDALRSGQKVSQNHEPAKCYIAESRVALKIPEGAGLWNPKNKKRKLSQRLRTAISPYYHIYKWYRYAQKNHWESIGPSIDYKPPRIILRDHYAYSRYRKETNAYPYYPFEKLDKFVYFPLQMQPEEAIDIIAPFFSNQIETARQVAMSLPDDYTLVVKEHPAMVGLRPPSYLEKLARTPNVKLIDYRISSQKVLSATQLVICTNGTTIAEAAFLRKPVIQLGNLGTTQKLPNVFRNTDMTKLPEKVKELLTVNLETSTYEKELEDFVASAYDCGFAINYITMWEQGKNKEEREKLWQAYAEELRSVLPQP